MLLLSLLFLSFLAVSFDFASFSEYSESSAESEGEVEVLLDSNLNLIRDDRTEDLRRIVIQSIESCDKENLFLLTEMKYDFFSTGVWRKMVIKDSFCGIMYLLKHYLIKKEDRRRAFRDSIKYGAISIFYYTLQSYRYRVKPESKHKQALLVQLACKRKQYRMLEHLANEGFNPNICNKNRQGRWLLHDAVISGDLELVKSLLRFKDLEMSCVDEKGNTPLHYASNMRIFEELLDFGVDPFIKNDLGLNSFFTAHPSFTSRLKLFQYYFRSQRNEDEEKRFASIIEGFMIRDSGPLFDGVDTSDIKFYKISSKFTGPVEDYRVAGTNWAKAVLMKDSINLKLAPSIVKLVYGKELEFEDLKDDNPVIYASLLNVKEPGFNFEGITLLSDKGVKVNDENLQLYLNEIAVDFMYTRYKEQIDQFKIGFNSIIEEEKISAFFTVSEFQKVLFGSFEMGRYEIYRKFEFCENCQIENVEMFWAAMDFLTESELIKFYDWITMPMSLNSFTGRSSPLNLPISINNIEKFVEIIKSQI